MKDSYEPPPSHPPLSLSPPLTPSLLSFHLYHLPGFPILFLSILFFSLFLHYFFLPSFFIFILFFLSHFHFFFSYFLIALYRISYSFPFFLIIPFHLLAFSSQFLLHFTPPPPPPPPPLLPLLFLLLLLLIDILRISSRWISLVTHTYRRSLELWRRRRRRKRSQRRS